MDSPFVVGALAFSVGFLLAFINYRISKSAIKKGGNVLSAASVARSVIGVAYLTALYFVSKLLIWDLAALLIGGALGITIPMFVFTYLLLKNVGGKSE